MNSENLFIQEHLVKNYQNRNPELGTRDKLIQLNIATKPTSFGTSPFPWPLHWWYYRGSMLLYLLPFYIVIQQDSENLSAPPNIYN